MKEIKNNENLEICSKCGGACCKRYAGAYIPEDFKGVNLHNIEEFEKILLEGNVSIDWYEDYGENGEEGYFIRPRHVGGDIVDSSWGSTCHYLTDKGCSLTFEERPYFCKKLVPNENMLCGEEKSKEKYADAWKDYYEVIERLRIKYDKGTYTVYE